MNTAPRKRHTGKPIARPIWVYSIRWGIPHLPCPGPRELARAEVPAGDPCPDEVAAHWKPGAGYFVTVDFPPTGPMRRWSQAAKATRRQSSLQRRLERVAPLFAEELYQRELANRPSYFDGSWPPVPSEENH